MPEGFHFVSQEKIMCTKKHAEKQKIRIWTEFISLKRARREIRWHLRKEQVSDELRARVLLFVLKAAENKIVLGNVQVVEI